MLINEIAHTDLERLTDVQFTDVLFRLLKFESEKFKFTGPKEILVPIKINVADAGEDGRVECENTNGSNWIRNKLSIFQVKARKMEGQDFYNEFFIFENNNPIGIKRLIEDTLDKVGEYVFFVSNGYNTDAKNRRKLKIVEAINHCNTHFGKNYNIDQIRILEGFQITNWVNEYINVVVAIKEYLGISRPEGAKTIEEWGTYEFLSRDDFVSNDWINSHIKIIQEELLIPRTVIRLLGHPGVGKSRIVYEALKTSAKLFKSNAIFIDGSSSDSSVLNVVGEIVRSSECIFIIDNCQRELHNKLEQEITRIGSKCSLLTIDFELSEIETGSVPNPTCKLIYYDSETNRSIVPSIIRNRLADRFADYQAYRLAELSNFLPEIALKLADLASSPTWDFSFVINENLLKRMLFGGRFIDIDKFNEYFEIAKIFAIFKFIPAPISKVNRGINNTGLHQSKIAFVTDIYDPPISERKYNDACEFFIKNKVLKKRGRFLTMALNPLSLGLAKEWWQVCPVSEAVSLMQNAPPELLVSLIERLKELDFSENVRNIADEIFGPNGYYSKPELLNSELNSRVFCALVEVNPEALMRTLVEFYDKATIAELRKIDEGRRNLLLSLEKLCFSKNTFNQAARILYRFAQAENESWSTNSRGIFKQLFRPYLSGTEADFNLRIEILQFALTLPLVENNDFLIEAIMAAFEIHGASRMGGAERQGTRVLSDFRPETKLEILEYWKEIIELLKNIWENYPEFREQVEKQFYIKSLQINSIAEPELVTNFIVWLESKDVSIPTSFYRSLEQQLTFPRIPEPAKIKIREFLISKEPQSSKDKFIRLVRDASYSPGKDESGVDIDQTELRVRGLVREFSERGIDITELLDLMLRGPQMYTEIFILEYLSLNKRDDQRMRLWDESVEKLKKIEAKERDWAVLNGVLQSSPENEKLSLILSLGEIGGFEEIFINLVNFHLKSVPELATVWNLIIRKGYSSETIYKLRVGHYAFDENFDSTRYICDKLTSLGDIGHWSALDILYRRLVLKGISDTAEWDYCKRTYEEYNYFNLETKPKFVEFYDLVEISQKLVKKFTDTDFFNLVTERLLNFLKSSHSLYFDDHFSELAIQLVEINFDEFWRKFSEELLSSDYFVYSAKNLYGSDHGNTSGGKEGILFTNPENWDKIIDWCKQNSTKGPIFIATLMPIYDSDGNTWHPFANKMINEFGNNPDFLSTMSANLGSFGWVGSPIDYYESEIKLYKQLLESPNLPVKDFARKQIEILQKLIERQKLEDEERFLGI